MPAKAKTPASAAAPKKKGGKLKFVFFMMIACLAMPFMLPTILMLLAGLIPTYVTFWTDDDPEKRGAACVSSMNIAGMVPFIIDLWAKGQTTGNALRILSESNTWFVILGAAAIGHLIAYAVPQAVATLSLTTNDNRIKSLKKNLELIKESWGADVGAVKAEKSGH
ncbi:MAG: hypothetical protein PHW76_10370 [Alphaproteobacteria bacterium]|nr:hypothetical protein [Alphaproteobacteria bacterium]